MIESAINKILALAPVQQLNIEGRSYTDDPIKPVLPPLQQALAVSTLTAIEDYFRDNPDGIDLSKAVIHIKSSTQVNVMSAVADAWLQRNNYLAVAIEHQGFPFGKYLPIENFMIAVQSYFVQDETTAALLKIVGNLSSDTNVNYQDDGVTQTITAKVGIAKLANIDLPNPISLAPYRTFLEVSQPSSSFVFRLKKSENGPMALLEEADGGTWKLECIKRVRDHLRSALPAGTIILA